jgi:hypothetical protein
VQRAGALAVLRHKGFGLKNTTKKEFFYRERFGASYVL